jgi:hypothetical protein
MASTTFLPIPSSSAADSRLKASGSVAVAFNPSSPDRSEYRNCRALSASVRRCNSAASRNADVVLAAASTAQLRTHVYASVSAAGSYPADSQGLAKASSHVPGTASVDLAANPPDSGATGRREPASPVALAYAALSSHQMPTARIETGNRPRRSVRSEIIPSTSHRPCKSSESL